MLIISEDVGRETTVYGRNGGTTVVDTIPKKKDMFLQDGILQVLVALIQELKFILLETV